MLITKTRRTVIETLTANDAALFLRYYQENQRHLSPWEPVRGPEYLTLPYWETFLKKAEHASREGSEFRFAAFTPDRSEIAGICNFTGVTRGVFQACFLGFSVAKKFESQGMMFEILQASIDHIFSTAGLNRIMANYMPANLRSGRLLERLGFEREGCARRYLKIAGRWEDHILTSLVNKVSIRSLSLDDLDLVTSIWTNPAVREYLGGPVSVINAAERLPQMLKSDGSSAWFFVAEYDGNQAGIISIERCHGGDNYEISYQFLPEFWGKGVAYASIRQVMNFARSVGITELTAETQALNDRSNRLLARLGMTEKNRLERFGAAQIVYSCRLN